jgi:hypothetical protein
MVVVQNTALWTVANPTEAVGIDLAAGRGLRTLAGGRRASRVRVHCQILSELCSQVRSHALSGSQKQVVPSGM